MRAASLAEGSQGSQGEREKRAAGGPELISALQLSLATHGPGYFSFTLFDYSSDLHRRLRSCARVQRDRHR